MVGWGGWRGCWFWDFLSEFVNHWEVWRVETSSRWEQRKLSTFSLSQSIALCLFLLSLSPQLTHCLSPTLFYLFSFPTTSLFSVGQFLFSSFWAISFPSPKFFSSIFSSPSFSVSTFQSCTFSPTSLSPCIALWLYILFLCHPSLFATICLDLSLSFILIPLSIPAVLSF